MSNDKYFLWYYLTVNSSCSVYLHIKSLHNHLDLDLFVDLVKRHEQTQNFFIMEFSSTNVLCKLLNMALLMINDKSKLKR